MQKAFLILIGTVFIVSGVSFYTERNKVETTVATENSETETETVLDIASSTEETKVVVNEEVAKKPVAAPTPPKIETKPEVIIDVPKIEVPKKVVDFEKINLATRSSVVNILCTTGVGSLSPISGTGILIHESGVILTNAHIAQYLLLKDLYYKDFIRCVARTGSPAYPKYTLELAYISPEWVRENTTTIKDQNPLGTGEYDFAFLRVTGHVDGTPISTNIPHTKPDIRAVIDIGESVVLVSYPAGFLGGQTIAQNLSLVSAITTIQDVFTYKEGTVDLLAVGGTVVSQKGSSGGAVVDDDGELLGVISTSTDGDTTGERDLRAITTGYINRSLEKDTGLNLEQFLNGDVEAFAQKFQTEKAPELTKILTDVLKRVN
ncbi:MAG: serine protease [Patescibacteria group bacterium]